VTGPRGLGELARPEGNLAAVLSQLARALTLAAGDGAAAQALWKYAHELFARLGVPAADRDVPVLET
jgi:hypothetical protein